MRVVLRKTVSIGRKAFSVDLMRPNIFICVEDKFVVDLVWELLTLGCDVKIICLGEGRFDVHFGVSRSNWSGGHIPIGAYTETVEEFRHYCIRCGGRSEEYLEAIENVTTMLPGEELQL